MIRKITIRDAEYPKLLMNIHRPPQELYVNGAFDARDGIAVAVVGSRRASPYGLEMAGKIAFDLASRGITVVSGMARGIDTAAHRGALKAGGRTIAVMGSGHNCIYPKENEKLYGEIAKTGAVITEYADDVGPQPFNFPRRNRIISGLSLGVVVVEAAKDSGALITAGLAAEQGREVFAVPGKISSSTSSGTNSLIRDGARLVQDVDDIIEELSIVRAVPGPDGSKAAPGADIARMTRAYVRNSLTPEERAAYRAVTDEPLHVDDIIERSGLGAGQASKALLGLQLKKLIQELPGKHYLRKEEPDV